MCGPGNRVFDNEPDDDSECYQCEILEPERPAVKNVEKVIPHAYDSVNSSVQNSSRIIPPSSPTFVSKRHFHLSLQFGNNKEGCDP